MPDVSRQQLCFRITPAIISYNLKLSHNRTRLSNNLGIFVSQIKLAKTIIYALH